MPSKANAATDADQKFLAMAAQSDQNEIALSQLAEQKATNLAVKAFAEKMVLAWPINQEWPTSGAACSSKMPKLPTTNLQLLSKIKEGLG